MLKRSSLISIHTFCPSFEFPDRALGERRITVQIVRIQDRIHVAQAVAGQARDLGGAASDDRKARDRSAAQIVKCESDIPAFVAAMRHDVWKPCEVHGRR